MPHRATSPELRNTLFLHSELLQCHELGTNSGLRTFEQTIHVNAIRSFSTEQAGHECSVVLNLWFPVCWAVEEPCFGLPSFVITSVEAEFDMDLLACCCDTTTGVSSSSFSLAVVISS